MASLAAVFKKHGVDTVICAAYAEGDALVKIEENLLEAALQSDVRRFSPSCWAAPAEQYVPKHTPNSTTRYLSFIISQDGRYQSLRE